MRVYPLVEFLHFVFTRMPGESTSSGGIFAHCIYSHANESTSSGGVYAPCIKTLLACQVRVHPLVEFMHLVFTRIPCESTYSGGVYMPCIYSHAM